MDPSRWIKFLICLFMATTLPDVDSRKQSALFIKQCSFNKQTKKSLIMKVDLSAGKTIKYGWICFFYSCCLVLFAPANNVSPEDREWDPEKRSIIGFLGFCTFVIKTSDKKLRTTFRPHQDHFQVQVQVHGSIIPHIYNFWSNGIKTEKKSIYIWIKITECENEVKKVKE